MVSSPLDNLISQGNGLGKAQIVRISIDQLASLIRALADKANDKPDSELAPGSYDCIQTSIAMAGNTVTPITAQNPRRWGLILCSTTAGNISWGINRNITPLNGILTGTTGTNVIMIGNNYRPFVARDIFAVSTIALTATCFEIIKQDTGMTL